MVASCTLSLRPPEKQALEAEARHAEKSYQREWAAASLKIAAIHSPHWVARYGLLTARDPDTVHGWLDHYAADRVAHWQVPHGCGRKPAFSPAQPDATTAQTALLQVVRRQPSLFGHAQTRWRLATILASCPWLHLTSLPGVSRLLKRLGITYQRGRDYVHGPAAHYQAKLDLVEQLRLRAYYAPEHYALLYLDEMSFYGQPSLSSAYAAQGEAQPRAERSQRSDTCARVVATLDAITGAVHYRQRSHIDTVTLAGFWADLRHACPTVTTLYVVVDNWPVHFHNVHQSAGYERCLPIPPKFGNRARLWYSECRQKSSFLFE